MDRERLGELRLGSAVLILVRTIWLATGCVGGPALDVPDGVSRVRIDSRPPVELEDVVVRTGERARIALYERGPQIANELVCEALPATR